MWTTEGVSCFVTFTRLAPTPELSSGGKVLPCRFRVCRSSTRKNQAKGEWNYTASDSDFIPFEIPRASIRARSKTAVTRTFMLLLVRLPDDTLSWGGTKPKGYRSKTPEAACWKFFTIQMQRSRQKCLLFWNILIFIKKSTLTSCWSFQNHRWGLARYCII